MDKVIVSGDARVVVRRRTVLTDARVSVIIGKLAQFFNAFCEALDEPKDVVNDVLTTYARVSGQATAIEGVEWELLLPTDTPEEMRAKCERYLEVANPDLISAAETEINTLNRSWANTGEKKASTPPTSS